MMNPSITPLLLRPGRILLRRNGFGTGRNVHSLRCSMEVRSRDKFHRQLIHDLNVGSKHRNGGVVLEPKLSHLVVELLNLVSKEKMYYRKSGKIGTKTKPALMMEIVVYNVIGCLLNIDNGDIEKRGDIEKSKEIVDKWGPEPLESVNSALFHIKSQLDHENTLNNHDNLSISVASFLVLSRISPEIEYLALDLVAWIRSVTSSNVSEACLSLKGLTDIPGFIISDVLTRTPMSKYELNLQLDLWLQFMDVIGKDYYNKITVVRSCLNNVIFYTTQYYPQKLPQLLHQLLKFFTSTKSGYQFKVITDEYLNTLLWRIPFDKYESHQNVDKSSHLSIIRCQETITKYISTTTTATKNLSLQGNMGIILAIGQISPKKALQLHTITRQKYTKTSHITKKSLLTYHYVNTILAQTPQELVLAFNEGANEFKMTSTLWLGFIKKLIEFELLTETRCIHVLKRIIDTPSMIITKNVMIHLFLAVESVAVMSEIMALLHQNLELIIKIRSILVLKWVSLLYKHQTNLSPSTITQLLTLTDITSINALTIARDLFNNIDRKSPRLIGTMLNGELRANSHNIYSLYQHHLADKAPDETCLSVLLRAAQVSHHGEPPIWTHGLYAPQVAIREFKENVSQTIHDDKLLPSQQLWCNYITLLTQYQYINEMSQLVTWWEAIEFSPDKETLAMLLKGLPQQFSQRFVSHIKKVKEDSTKAGLLGEIESRVFKWPWPSDSER